MDTSPSPFFVPVLTGHAISTLMQSIAWLVLTIICFLYYSEVYDIALVESTYKNALETWMYRLYLHKNNHNSTINYEVLNITPGPFITFCSIYFVLSIILITMSIIVIYTLRNMKDKRFNIGQYCIFLIWIFSGLVQGLLDLIFFALLLDDYNYYGDQRFTKRHMGTAPTAIGVVMTIVARGFVLWVLNLAMDATSMCMIIQQYRKERDFKEELFPPMERRSPLRRSMSMSEDRRPYSPDRSTMAGRSNDSYIPDRYEHHTNRATPPTQGLQRSSSIIARFNPPPEPGVTRRNNTVDIRFDNGYASDQGRRARYSSSGEGSDMRNDSHLHGGR